MNCLNTSIKRDSVDPSSPSNQMIIDAQMHFNNQTLNAFHSSPQNSLTLNSQKQQSPSSYRKQRPLFSPGMDNEFVELDQFLTNTYEKHGVYNIVRAFIDMEDQLALAFEYKKRQMKKKQKIHQMSQKNQVNSFEEINESEEIPVETEENIVYEFLYNLHNLFTPSPELLKKFNSLHLEFNADFSFSGEKPRFQTSMIGPKINKYIHNSRSQRLFGKSLKSSRNLINSEQRIDQNISLNKNYVPFRNSLIKPHQVDSKEINSDILIEDSLQTSNNYIQRQQELLRTIFELRQQILQLKQEKYIKNGDFSQGSSFQLDGSWEQHNFKNREISNSPQQNTINLDHLEQKSPRSKILQARKKSPKIQSPSNKNIVNQIVSSGNSSFSGQKQLQSGSNSFSLGMLDSVQQEQFKENNQFLINTEGNEQKKTDQDYSFEKRRSQKASKTLKKQEQLIFSKCQRVELPKSEKNPSQKFFETMISEAVQNALNLFKKLMFYEAEAQAIFISMIQKKIPLDSSVKSSFYEFFDWHGKLKILSAGRIEFDLQKFMKEFQGKRFWLNDLLKRNYHKNLKEMHLKQ